MKFVHCNEINIWGKKKLELRWNLNSDFDYFQPCESHNSLWWHFELFYLLNIHTIYKTVHTYTWEWESRYCRQKHRRRHVAPYLCFYCFLFFHKMYHKKIEFHQMTTMGDVFSDLHSYTQVHPQECTLKVPYVRSYLKLMDAFLTASYLEAILISFMLIVMCFHSNALKIKISFELHFLSLAITFHGVVSFLQ